MLFGAAATMAIQDPAYPANIDSSVIMGTTGGYEQSHRGYAGIQYMTCRPETGFFPDLAAVRPCSQLATAELPARCAACLQAPCSEQH